jgi:cytochrome c553
MLKNLCILISSVLLGFCSSAYANGDIAAGKTKSTICAACHGNDGNGVEALQMQPKLAGQHAEYTDKQLHEYKSGARNNAIMAPMAANLSDEDIADLAVYYASLKGTTGTSTAEQLEAGKKLYRAGDAATGLAACSACHGPSGKGNPAAKYPAVAGQFAEYTAIQLQAFKSETRANDSNSVMRSVAARMTNEQIDAVADYIEGLY